MLEHADVVVEHSSDEQELAQLAGERDFLCDRKRNLLDEIRALTA